MGLFYTGYFQVPLVVSPSIVVGYENLAVFLRVVGMSLCGRPQGLFLPAHVCID